MYCILFNTTCFILLKNASGGPKSSSFQKWKYLNPLRWRHNELDGVSDHQPHDCLLNRLFGRRSKKTSKLRVIGLCAWNSPGTGEFPAQMASKAENVSIWWRHHALLVNISVAMWHHKATIILALVTTHIPPETWPSRNSRLNQSLVIVDWKKHMRK